MQTPYHTAGFLKRLAALLYDVFILFSIMILATLIILPINHFKPIPPKQPLYQGYLVLIAIAYYFLSWYKGGQTIGLRAWNLKLISVDYKPLQFKQLFKRILFAIPSMLFCLVGLLWALVDKQKQTLYDKLSETRVIDLRF